MAATLGDHADGIFLQTIFLPVGDKQIAAPEDKVYLNIIMDVLIGAHIFPEFHIAVLQFRRKHQLCAGV